MAGVHIPIIQEQSSKTEENSRDREATKAKAKVEEMARRTERIPKSPTMTEIETTNPGIETTREDRKDQETLKDPGIHQEGLKEVREKGNRKGLEITMTAVEIPENPLADLALASHHLENPTGHHVETT